MLFGTIIDIDMNDRGIERCSNNFQIYHKNKKQDFIVIQGHKNNCKTMIKLSNFITKISVLS